MNTETLNKYAAPVFYLTEDLILEYEGGDITVIKAGVWKLYDGGNYFCINSETEGKQLLNKDEFCGFVRKCLYH